MRRAVLASAALIACLWSGSALAERTRRVVVGPAGSDADYTSVQVALEAARVETSDIATIFVRRDDYSGDLSLVSGVDLVGEEAARTTLKGTITGQDVDTVSVTGFTIEGELVLKGARGVEVRHNLFMGDTLSSSTDLSLQGRSLDIDTEGVLGAADIVVENNTFYNSSPEGTAIAVRNPSGLPIAIVGNVIYRYNLAFHLVEDASATITDNLLFDNERSIQQGGTLDPSNLLVTDPLFLDPLATPRDLHRSKDVSDCSFGAYGGDDADPTPFPPKDLTAKPREIDGKTADIEFTWTPHRACNFEIAAFELSYSESAASDPVALVTDVAAGATSYVLDVSAGLPGTAAEAPPPPAATEVSPRDGGLLVRWDEVTNASGYRVYWGTASGVYSGMADVGDVHEHTITGLQNGVPYYAAVKSYANSEREFYLAEVGRRPGDGETGESARTAPVTAVLSKEESAEFSPEATEVPAAIVGYPLLDANGCFVSSLGQAPDLRLLAAVALALAALALAKRSPRVRRGRAFATAALVLLPSASHAVWLDDPRWVVTLAGGGSQPVLDRWEEEYDESWFPEFKAGFGVRLLPWVELGVQGGYRYSKGTARTNERGVDLGTDGVRQEITLLPAHAYALLNFELFQGQWVVPYVGGGYSRYTYRKEVEDGETTTGHSQGYHLRGGLKFLLNRVDPRAAGRAKRLYGVDRTYFFVEAQEAKIQDFEADAPDLGGRSYFGGVAVEF